jgi:hypothetical protein
MPLYHAKYTSQDELDNLTHDLEDVPCDQIVPNHNLRFKIQPKAI